MTSATASGPTSFSRSPKWAEEIECAPRWTKDPYPGLRAFETGEAAIFFGRKEETKELCSRIQGGCRFLAVLGASGSGKSSLVRAGLLSELSDKHWTVLTMKPHEYGDKNPLTALSAAIQRQAQDRGSTNFPEPRDIRAGSVSVSGWLDALLRGRPYDLELLLFVDQFEELFTEVDEKARDSFVEVLDPVAQHPRGRVVVTMRTDFLPQFERNPVLVKCLNANGGPYLVPPLGPDRYREIICGPAGLAGFEVKPDLLARIMDKAKSAPGAVPLIAFALDKLYCTVPGPH